MLTLTILSWLLARAVYVCNFGWPQSGDDGDRAAALIVVPAAVIGAGLYYDLFGSFPPSPGSDLILYFLISGLVSLAGFSLVALARLLTTPVRGYSGGVVRGVVSAVGLASSILGIVGFYLDHLR